MKILMVASDNSVASGAFNSMVILSRNLISSGCDVTVLIPKKGDGIELLRKHNIPYVYIRTMNWTVPLEKNIKSTIKKVLSFVKHLYNVIPYYRIKKYLKKNSVDIVHMNTSWTYVAALAAKNSNIKYVWHIREFLESGQKMRMLFRNFGYKLMGQSSAIICTSNSILNEYKKYFDEKIMYVIYNGIDASIYNSDDRVIFSEKTINLLCVGGVNEQKGQLTVSKVVCKLVKDMGYNLKLYLVGDCFSEEKQYLLELQEKYKVNCINIEGRQKNVVDYYRNTDIFVMSSLYEAFGRVTVEAMLCNCLVIGYNSTGTSEIIEDGVNGYLYNNVEELKDCLIKAISDIDLSRKMAKIGTKVAYEKYTDKINSINVLNLYKKI